MRLVSPVIARSDFGLLMEVRPELYADLTALFGRPEEQVVQAEIEHLSEGMTFVDVGANVGRYTLLAAKCVGDRGRVIAFEPDPHTYGALQKSVEINGLDQITISDVAVSDVDGQGNLLTGADPGWSTLQCDWLSHMQHGQLSDIAQNTVQLSKLDTLLKNMDTDVDLLKIDVEGGEMNVLLGAHELLDSGTIKRIVCEVHHPVVKAEDVIDLLSKFRYRTEQKGIFVLAELQPS